MDCVVGIGLLSRVKNGIGEMLYENPFPTPNSDKTF